MLAMSDKDGVVEGSIPGLAHIAGVTIQEAELALQKLQRPDKYSRTPDHYGRRIEVIPGGWLILNRAKYRDMDWQGDKVERHREANRRYYLNKKSKSDNSDQQNSESDSVGYKKEKEKEKEKIRNEERDARATAEMFPDVEERLLKIAKAHPKGATYSNFKQLPFVLKEAIVSSISDYATDHSLTHEEAYAYILQRTLNYRDRVATWPKREWRFSSNIVDWFARGMFTGDETTWQRCPDGGNSNGNRKHNGLNPDRSLERYTAGLPGDAVVYTGD
jgi:hypothetical protein